MTVFCGPSIWRQIDVRTMGGMLAAMMNAPVTERVIWAPIWNDALIGRSRSLMCTEFLKTDADVMVIIDDDIVFEPDDFWKIVEGARETRGIYGGAYVTRSTEPHISSRALPDTGPQRFAKTPERRPIEYQYLATGFWAMHRDVLEAMIGAEFTDAYGGHKIELVEIGADRPFYPFFQPFTTREDDGRLHYLSEDWAFCNRARQLFDHPVWVDLSIILVHMGLYPYTVRDMQTLKEPGLPSTGIDVVDVRLEFAGTGEPLLDTLVDHIAEWAEEDAGDIRRRLDYGPQYLAQLWEQRGDMSEEDWYRQEDVGLAYVLDLARWHLADKGTPFALAEKLAGKRVLDYGAGIGTFSLAAARAGATVTTYEPNQAMRSFQRFRAEKHDLPLNVAEIVPEAQFDAVVCWHVFEHLEDPESVLRTLRRMLSPGGVLISQSGFSDQSTPMHHAHADWSAELRRAGFIADPLVPDLYHLADVVEAVPA